MFIPFPLNLAALIDHTLKPHPLYFFYSKLKSLTGRGSATLGRAHSLDSGLNASSSYTLTPSNQITPLYMLLNSGGRGGGKGEVAESSDVHICVLCVKALMNNAVSELLIVATECIVSYEVCQISALKLKMRKL